MDSLTTGQKAMIFRSLSATAYLSILVASFHAAFTGFIHFLVGIPVCVIALAMLLVQMAPVLGGIANGPLEKLEEFHYNGETIRTFRGRVVVDALLIFILFFYMKRHLLAVFTAALIGAVIALKDREVDLFQEVFPASSGPAGGGGGMGESASWTTTGGGYQQVVS